MAQPAIDADTLEKRLELLIASTRQTIDRAKAFLERSRRRTKHLTPHSPDEEGSAPKRP